MKLILKIRPRSRQKKPVVTRLSATLSNHLLRDLNLPHSTTRPLTREPF